MTEQNDATAIAEAEKKNELRLKMLKDAIASQANTFDQIDSKTGVALGFTFVVVGQVLASVFRMATDQSHFQSSHAALTATTFVLASCLAIAAIISGIIARWPREFCHAVYPKPRELEGSYEKLLNGEIDALSKAESENKKTNRSKGWWAQATYLLVGAALIGYLGLTIILYAYSIPNENQKSDKAATMTQDSPHSSAGPQDERDPKIQRADPAAIPPNPPSAQRAEIRPRTTPSSQRTPPLRSETEIEQRVKRIIVEQLQVDQSKVTPNANFKQDLGADDLDVTELVMQLEEQFNLEIPDEDAKRLVNVNEAVDYIEQHVNQSPQK